MAKLLTAAVGDSHDGSGKIVVMTIHMQAFALRDPVRRAAEFEAACVELFATKKLADAVPKVNDAAIK